MSDDGCCPRRDVNNGSIEIESERLSEIFDALAHERRRYALYHLQEHERAQLQAVAERVAAWERDCPPDELSSETCDRIENELYHVHLPKLEAAALVEYDSRSGAIRFRDPPDALDSLLEICGRAEPPD